MVRTGWSQLLANPDFAIDWQIVDLYISRIYISRIGNLAFTFCTYKLTIQGPDAKSLTDRGTRMATWKKQPDGSWKIIADTFKSDLPFPVAKVK